MPTKIFAHRGASAYAPENTLPVFQLAIDQGADGIELDVHLTADLQPVVLHDSALMRTAGVSGVVEDFTLDELRTFDFGYATKFGSLFAGTQIPTLRQVFDLLAPTDLELNIELKEVTRTRAKIYLETLVRETQNSGMAERVCFSSFDHLALVELLSLFPSAKIAPLYSETMLHPWDYAKSMNADGIHPAYKQLFVFPEYLTLCHSHGITVRTWTVDDAETISALVHMGVDAIITNKPDIAKQHNSDMYILISEI